MGKSQQVTSKLPKKNQKKNNTDETTIHRGHTSLSALNGLSHQKKTADPSTILEKEKEQSVIPGKNWPKKGQ